MMKISPCPDFLRNYLTYSQYEDVRCFFYDSKDAVAFWMLNTSQTK